MLDFMSKEKASKAILDTFYSLLAMSKEDMEFHGNIFIFIVSHYSK